MLDLAESILCSVCVTSHNKSRQRCAYCKLRHTNTNTLNSKRACMTQTLSGTWTCHLTPHTWATEPGATQMMLLALPGRCTLHIHTFSLQCCCSARAAAAAAEVLASSLQSCSLLRLRQQRALIGLHAGKMLSRIFFVVWSIQLLRSTQERVRSACFHPSRAQENYHSWN